MTIDEISFDHYGKCPYLNDRYWSLLKIISNDINAGEYENLLNIGFRKNGNIYYLPKCSNCEECKSLRVLVNDYIPSKKSRKLLKKNSDIRIRINKPVFTEEKLTLYKKYLKIKHNDDLQFDVNFNYNFSFLASTKYSQEMCYYLKNRLIGVSFIEILKDSISSVYFFYDVDYMDRSLGIFSIIKELEYTKRINKKYLHLGYYVEGCSAMTYKARFKPNEILIKNSLWVNGEYLIKNS